jgi:ribosomal protein S18 acetylase RimI-like enzyme
MIIRYAKHYDLRSCGTYVYRRNLKDMFYSGYMPGKHHSIIKEINQAISKNQVLIAETRNLVQGILVWGKYDESSTSYDVAGPYIESESVSLAVEMLETMQADLDQKLDLNFFFKENSSFYTKFMKRINATFNSNEYVLRLNKEDFTPLESDEVFVKKMEESDASKVKAIHDDIFQNVYVTSDMVLKSKEAYLIYTKEDTIGYAVVRNQPNRLYLELFGITETFRNKGYGRKALSKVLAITFESSKKTVCDLVVEADNRQATRVYKDAGFKELSTNVSYTLKAKA